jgi:hypothetical protein
MSAATLTILIGLMLRVVLPLVIVLLAGTLLQALTGQKGA